MVGTLATDRSLVKTYWREANFHADGNVRFAIASASLQTGARNQFEAPAAGAAC
jgi:hypothetical protein